MSAALEAKVASLVAETNALKIEMDKTAAEHAMALDMGWTCIAAFFVFFMHAGYYLFSYFLLKGTPFLR